MRKALCIMALLVVALLQSVQAQTVTMNVSAYTHTGGVMANGQYPYVGAAASDDLPIGTKVMVNGSVYTILDRFGGGYRNRLDLFMDSYDEAIEFGRQWLDVKILR